MNYYLISIGISGIVFWWFLRGSRKPARIQPDGDRLLYYGPRPKAFSLFATISIDGLLLWVWYHDANKTANTLMCIVFVIALIVFALPGGSLLLVSLRNRIVFSKDGITEFAFSKAQRTMMWVSIKRIEFNSNTIVLHGFDESKISVSMYMNGIREFFAELEKRVPRWVKDESHNDMVVIRGMLR